MSISVSIRMLTEALTAPIWSTYASGYDLTNVSSCALGDWSTFPTE